MFKDTFLDYMQAERRFSAHTIKAYLNDIEDFLYYLKYDNIRVGKHIKEEFNWGELTDINTQVIRGWMSSMLGCGLDPVTIRRKTTSLSTLYRHLMRKGIVNSNPVQGISKPKISKKLPVFFDENKLGNFIDSSNTGNTYEDVRNFTIIEALYSTGIRVSELSGLEVNDIDFYNETIKVLGKRNKERLIPMTTELKEILKIYLAERDSYINDTTNKFLFLTAKGKKMYEKAIYLLVKNQMTLAGFSGKRSPHIMRHTFATHMLDNGADINSVKELLGHANLAATQVYTHNTLEKLKKVYTKSHPRA